MPLTSIDWAVIIGYLLINLLIGIYYRRRASGNTEEFFVSGRDVSWWLAGTSMVATPLLPIPIAGGVVPTGANPVPDAKWLHKVKRPEKQVEYSLETVLQMLRILEPLDLRAAVAVALAYFAALRPAEIRGLK